MCAMQHSIKSSCKIVIHDRRNDGDCVKNELQEFQNGLTVVIQDMVTKPGVFQILISGLMPASVFENPVINFWKIQKASLT